VTRARDRDDPLVVVMKYFEHRFFVIEANSLRNNNVHHVSSTREVSEISRAYIRCSHYRMWYTTKTAHGFEGISVCLVGVMFVIRQAYVSSMFHNISKIGRTYVRCARYRFNSIDSFPLGT
jgi:hypothetical protein